MIDLNLSKISMAVTLALAGLVAPTGVAWANGSGALSEQSRVSETPFKTVMTLPTISAYDD